MTKVNKIHLTIISIINLIFVAKIISIVWEGNDKAIILVIFAYPILIIINGLVWLTLRLLKRPEYEIYKMTTIGLAILFIPTLILSCLY